MNRNPPPEVKQELRAEVGFGCPVPGCGNPYLEWHHFDPPWNEENHHDPARMIALCGPHHKKADNKGAFTNDQLRKFKAQGRQSWMKIKGKFDWMRNSLLVMAGGAFYYKIPVIFQYYDEPIIWFERNEEEYLLLNVKMLSTTEPARLLIRNNEWFANGNEIDIVSPPSGKSLDVKYPNGDYFAIKFLEISDSAEFRKEYPKISIDLRLINFPITGVNITYDIADTKISFTPAETKLEGFKLSGGFISDSPVGISIG